MRQPWGPVPPWSPRSGRWRQPGRSQRVRGLGFDGDEKALFRTGKQPVHQSLVGTGLTPDQSVLATVNSFDLELLPWLDAVELPNFDRQDNLAFGRDGCSHVCKIPSYFRYVNRGNCAQVAPLGEAHGVRISTDSH